VKLQCAAALAEARRIEGTMEMEGMDGKGGKEGKEMGVRARLGYLSSAPPRVAKYATYSITLFGWHRK